MRGVFRFLLTVVMDLLLVVAAALFVRIIVGFFGQISIQSWAVQLSALTRVLVAPLGFHRIVSPYHGVFDVNGAVTLLVVFGAEWLVALWRHSVRR
jgi:hypothetical protein